MGASLDNIPGGFSALLGTTAGVLDTKLGSVGGMQQGIVKRAWLWSQAYLGLKASWTA